ncbi:hypothetical protein [uncultured Nostoc sp.]|uniref:hypothetical protein n=1 Tax=uncultured Nostoc sp. TaxID=340711 RepID=UPI0035CC2006
MKLVALKPGLNFESSIPSGDARSDARSDAPTSLTLRYRYRFSTRRCANANAALTAVTHGGNPLQPFS